LDAGALPQVFQGVVPGNAGPEFRIGDAQFPVKVFGNAANLFSDMV
jgi:hypothetical protein